MSPQPSCVAELSNPSPSPRPPRSHLITPPPLAYAALALLLGASEVKILLDDHRFNPEVSSGDAGGFSIWLGELELYGQGPDYEAAKEDLLDEIREYVGEYLSDSGYVRAPNRASHLPYVIRAYIADREGDLESVIIARPAGSQRGSTSS
jgi:hypothetical protein